MGFWAFYFLAKLYLYFRGYIPFHAMPNALLLAFVALPEWKPDLLGGPARALHRYAAIAAGAMLLWYDSYFPPLTMVLDFVAKDSTRPTPSYMLSFLMGYWNLWEALALAGLFAATVFAHTRRWRTAPLVLVLMAVPAIRNQAGGLSSSAIDDQHFYAQETKRTVRFDPPAAGSPPFDILIIHICSLSWDDLKQIGMQSDPFFSRLSVMFTNFNSVTSYSNPSALRLLRSGCGQPPHSDLYDPASPDCYLLEALRREGYKTYTVFNHDGKYSNMAQSVAELGKADPPLRLANLPVDATDFDGSPIYNNFAALDAWWKVRQKDDAPRAALYFNTLSLHDGAHGVNDKEWWKRARPDKYREFAQALFGDLGRFLDEVAGSGRDALVVFVPEHGAALAGSRIQAKGLRDIPLPNITNIPVGLAFIGQHAPPAPATQRRIDRPSSYLALSYLIAEAIRRRASPQADPLPQTSLDAAPETPFLAENQYARVFQRNGVYYLQGKDKVWNPLPTDLIAEGRTAPK